MKKLAEFRRIQRRIATDTALLEKLKHDPEFKKDFEFESKLRALLEEYGLDVNQAFLSLAPEAEAIAHTITHDYISGLKKRKPRSVKLYTNPHTGDTVETKGGNHKTIQYWKQRYGPETVESWWVISKRE